jgi:hypothetical protein
METDADKALRYLERAQQLRKVAAAIKDEKSRQVILEAAQHYEEMAAQQTVRRPISD